MRGEEKNHCTRELEDLRRRIAELEARQTEWWKAEKSLREINQTLQAIFDASPLAIIALDREARVRLWSPAAERIFGWKAEEVMGRMHPIVTENTQDEFWSELTQILGGKGYLGHEVLRRKKDGSPINLSVSTAPLRDAEDNIVGAMGVIADITEQVRADWSKP
jgi:PAS domain S-box-containing protein